MREWHTRGDVSRSPKWRASSQAGGSCEESRERSTQKGSQVGRRSLARSHAARFACHVNQSLLAD